MEGKLPPRPEKKPIPPRTESILDKLMDEMTVERKIESIKEQWQELLTENEDLDVITSILEDDNLMWIRRKKGNDLIYLQTVLDLVKTSTLIKNKEIVISRLQKELVEKTQY